MPRNKTPCRYVLVFHTYLPCLLILTCAATVASSFCVKLHPFLLRPCPLLGRGSLASRLIHVLLIVTMSLGTLGCFESESMPCKSAPCVFLAVKLQRPKQECAHISKLLRRALHLLQLLLLASADVQLLGTNLRSELLCASCQTLQLLSTDSPLLATLTKTFALCCAFRKTMCGDACGTHLLLTHRTLSWSVKLWLLLFATLTKNSVPGSLKRLQLGRLRASSLRSDHIQHQSRARRCHCLPFQKLLGCDWVLGLSALGAVSDDLKANFILVGHGSLLLSPVALRIATR